MQRLEERMEQLPGDVEDDLMAGWKHGLKTVLSAIEKMDRAMREVGG